MTSLSSRSGSCGAAGPDQPARARAKRGALIAKPKAQEPGPRLPVRQQLRGVRRGRVHRRHATARTPRRPASRPRPTSGRRTSAGPVAGPARSAPSNTWTVHDEDAYRGPFTSDERPGAGRRQLLGPGDELRGAVSAVQAAAEQPVAVQRQLGSHRLRHLGVRDGQCRQLPAVAGGSPAKGKVCVGDVQPFQTSPAGARTAFAVPNAAPARKQLPPVVAPMR